MGECKLDHSLEDVKSKYEAQVGFLPPEIKTLFEAFLAESHPQEILNDVFHLLKKYDLATLEERNNRNHRIQTILSNL